MHSSSQYLFLHIALVSQQEAIGSGRNELSSQKNADFNFLEKLGKIIFRRRNSNSKFSMHGKHLAIIII